MKADRTNLFLSIIIICSVLLSYFIYMSYNAEAVVKYKAPTMRCETVVIDSFEYIQYTIVTKEQAYEGLIPKSNVIFIKEQE